MALNGPLTLDDLIALTGGKKRPAVFVPPVICGGKDAATTRLRLLGIDPGTRFVGWGVIERNSRARTLTMIKCGCIRATLKADLKIRLREIFEELEAIIAKHKPHAAALEETFAGVNMKSAIAMGEGRGIALLALARAGLDVLEVSPRSIKHAVTGTGAASKPRVAAMVCAQLGLKKTPKPADVTDALAVAITLANRLA